MCKELLLSVGKRQTAQQIISQRGYPNGQEIYKKVLNLFS